MSTVAIRSLTIKEMQDYYDRIHGGRATVINRGGLETWNPKIRDGEIKLPPEFACVSDGKVLTWDDVKQRRRERQKAILEQKRWSYGQIQKKPLYVWVFFCPGISNFFFRGWYTYFEGMGISCSLDRRDRETVLRLMELFPLVEPKLFGPPNLDEWMAEFVRRYQRGHWCGKPQGKSPVWAEVQGGYIRRILGRVEWPESLKANRVNECG